MSYLAAGLRECLVYLNSTRINEKKKGAEQLSNYLNRNDIISFLNKASDDDEFTWTTVFEYSHLAAYNELCRMKQESRKGSKRIFPVNYVVLVGKVARTANADFPLLECGKVTDSVLQIFQYDFIVEEVVDYYINILHHNILPVNKYHGVLYDYWQELYDYFVKFYGDPNVCKSNRSIIINSLALIVKYGCRHSYLTLAIKKNCLDFVTRVIEGACNGSFSYQSDVLLFASTVCEQLKKECRLMICKFGENVMQSVLNMYEEGLSRKRDVFFDFLLLIVQLHHPYGAEEGSAVAYANQWKEWNKCLKKVYCICSREIDALQKYNKVQELNSSFLLLVIEVCKQVFSTNFSHFSASNNLSSSYKRAKVIFGFKDLIEKLKEATKLEETCPWLQISATLISRYPTTIEEDGYVMLLKFCCDALNASKNELITDYLCQCCISLIGIRNHVNRSVIDEEYEISLWESVSEIIIRTMSLNQNVKYGNALLRLLIPIVFKPGYINVILKLYLSDTVHLSEHSLETLYCLRLFSTFPDTISDISVWNTLLNWMLPCKLNEQQNDSNYLLLPLDLLAQTTILVTGTSKACRSLCIFRNNSEPISVMDDMNNFYSLSCFESSLLNGDGREYKLSPTEAGDEHLDKFVLNEKAFSALLNKVNSDVELMLNFCSAEVQKNSVKYLSSMVVFLSNTINFAHIYGINLKEKYSKTLEIMIKKLMDMVEILLKLNDVKCSIEVFRYIRTMFESVSSLTHVVSNNYINYTKNIETIEFIEQLIFSGIDSLTDIDYCNRSEMMNDVDLMQNCKSMVLSEEFVVEGFLAIIQFYYNEHQTDCYTSTHLNNLLKKINSADMDYSREYIFYMLPKAIDLLLKVNSMQSDLLENVINCIQNLCLYDDWHKTEQYSVVILKLIQRSIIKMLQLDSSECCSQLINLISAFKKSFLNQQKRCGPEVTEQFIRCLSLFNKKKVLCLWSSDLDLNNSPLIAEDVCDYIKSPFYQLRLVSAYCVSQLFASLEHGLCNTESQKDNYFIRLFKSFKSRIYESFLIQNLSDDEKQDEALNRSVSAFHCVAYVICSSVRARRDALYLLFEIAHQKNIQPLLVRNTCNLIKEHLHVRNVEVFLQDIFFDVASLWYRDYKTFKNFPWKILRCNTETDFVKNYLGYIFPLLILAMNEVELNRVAQIMEMELNVIIEEYFPFIMALIWLQLSSEKKIIFDGFADAKDVYTFLEDSIGEDRIKHLISTLLPEIVISLISFMHDPSYLLHPKCLLLSSPAISFNKCDTLNSFNKLQKKLVLKNNISLMTYFCAFRLPCIQKILLNLYVGVREASIVEIRSDRFQKYVLFCEMLMDFLLQYKIQSLPIFVITTVLHNLLSFLSSEVNSTHLLLSVLKYLSNFIKQSLQININVVEKYLNTIVGKLLPLTETNNDLCSESLKVLNIIFIDNADRIHESVLSLDPFPNDNDSFSAIREIYKMQQSTQTNGQTLAHEIERFLSAGQNKPHLLCRLEGLKQLKEQLSTSKLELKQLFQDLKEMRGVSKDFHENILHKLICALVKLTQTANNEVNLEAVCCLGQLGLADLHSYVLQPIKNRKLNISPAKSFINKIVQLLTQYVIEDDIAVMQASSDALYAILESRERRKQADSRVEVNDLEQHFIKTFILTDGKSYGPLQQYFVVEDFVRNVNKKNVWTPDLDSDISYECWVVNLVCALLDSFPLNNYMRLIYAVCKLKVPFSEQILPRLIYLIIYCDKKISERILVERINSFFKEQFLLYQNNDNVKKTGKKNRVDNIYHSKASIQLLLKVVQSIYKKHELYVNDINLDYLYISWSAQFCSSYFTSLLYVELWLNTNVMNLKICHDGSFSQAVEKICKNNAEDKDILFSILREAYNRLGDEDALYGYGSSNLDDHENRIRYYQQIGDWQRVVEMCNCKLLYQPNDFNIAKVLASSLGFMGMNVLQSVYLNSVSKLNHELEDLMYECSWRLNKWDVPDPASSDGFSFSYHRYSALRNISRNNNLAAFDNLVEARRAISLELSQISLEATKNIYEPLSKLHTLQEIEDFMRNDSNNNVYRRWKEYDDINSSLNFEYLEPIYSQRINLLNHGPVAYTSRLDIANIAGNDQNYNFAELCLTHLRNMPNISEIVDLKMKLEEAKLLWKRKDTFSARCLLESILKSTSEHVADLSSLRLNTLRLYGCLLLETNLESFDSVYDKYFTVSLDMIESNSNIDQDNRIAMYKCISEFADNQYQCITQYIKSNEFAEIVKNVNTSSKQKTSNRDRMAVIYEKNQKILDDNEVLETKTRRIKYLILAVKYYLKILSESDNEDMSIFRIVSLWLDNKQSLRLHEEMINLSSMPTYKFVPVLTQLIPHIKNSKDDNVASVLNPLIEKCALEHPHHTLRLLLTLANFYKDKEYCSSTVQNENSSETRYVAAKNMITKFRSSAEIGHIVKEMELITDAYISFAYYSGGGYGKKVESVIPNSQKIMSVRDFAAMQCPTVELEISKTADYSKVLGIHKFENKFFTACGLSAPKRVVCVCTDGKSRYQLIKGRDDLRQDAVMQQVFTNLNKLLMENKLTSKRNLLIRTYKVIPLSQRSGVIEWCDNTTSLGNYLVGIKHPPEKGAHVRYRPSDMSPEDARRKIDFARERSDMCDKRLEEYNLICSRLQPVFRYFFFEKFSSPTMWFERKLAYIHSLATTSIIGYVLGIGDRHLQNILIDQKSAELIHIDFGVAFEQGLLLCIPEFVPFRLSRDMEDGMGVFAIDGIFRRCCEKTLYVLRQNKNIIRTALEVFLYDPLYLWTMTVEKAAAVQKSEVPKQRAAAKTTEESSSGEFNKTAERALTRIRLKLEGLEEGTVTTIEGQVNRLIQQAKDPKNLSKLFSGWQAYL